MEIIEVVTEQMAYGGAALARHEGLVLFVPFALPGERVRVRVPPTTKRWVEAELVEVLEASPERIVPLCPHFGPGKCGGCQWQHASYEAQLRYKSEIVREQLERIGKIQEPSVRPCLGMAEPWRYRNHVQLRVIPEGLGFVREDQRGIYPIDVCFIMNEAIYELFQEVKKQPLPQGVARVVLRGSARTGERLLILEGTATTVPAALPQGTAVARRDRKGRVQLISGKPEYQEALGGRHWRVGANSFFQVNTEQAERLLGIVRDLAGPFRGDEVLLDSYAGSGLFGLSLAREVGQTFLVESHPAAVADARRHAVGQANVTIIEATSEGALPNWQRYGPRPDLALLDPPRAGCKEPVLHALGKLQVPTIIYISCDPATQARDLRILLDQGYTLDIVQPVDLFPQTYHVESVARLHFFPSPV
ncbi:MAG: class I SAM-dependent RNA methyltransferase [Ardenticatenales bacterium]|nr:class I SAM-dependent RNA methyltransferase [Ardenticatenales bacterium]